MMYIVIRDFFDLTDDARPYKAGDTYPRPGLDVSAERLAELAGNDNRMGHPLIVDADAPCAECVIGTSETPIEAAEVETKEIPAESVKTPKKASRSRNSAEQSEVEGASVAKQDETRDRAKRQTRGAKKG